MLAAMVTPNRSAVTMLLWEVGAFAGIALTLAGVCGGIFNPRWLALIPAGVVVLIIAGAGVSGLFDR